MQGPSAQSRTSSRRAVVFAESALECVIGGSSWVARLQRGLKTVRWGAGSRASWRCRPSSAATCVLPGATQRELQSDLHVAATCAGLGGVRERPSCESRLVAASVGPGPSWCKVQGLQKPDAAYMREIRKI